MSVVFTNISIWKYSQIYATIYTIFLFNVMFQKIIFYFYQVPNCFDYSSRNTTCITLLCTKVGNTELKRAVESYSILAGDTVSRQPDTDSLLIQWFSRRYGNNLEHNYSSSCNVQCLWSSLSRDIIFYQNVISEWKRLRK